MAINVETNKKNNFNQTVMFIEGISIKFNEKGIGSVKDQETAKKVVENSDFVFYEGQTPVEENKHIPIINDKKKDDFILELQNKLHIANQRVDTLKAEKGLLESNLKDWQEEFNKITKENESLKKMISEPTTKKNEEISKESDNPPEEELEEDIEKKLTAMKVSDLKDMCKDLKLDPGEWETLKKVDLIKYLIEKSEK